MAITIDYKKPTATNYALGVHLGDEREATRIFWFNEGIEITDRWAYPTVQATYEKSLDTPQVCQSEENPSDRITCTFASKLVSEIQKAQATFEQATGDRVQNNFDSLEKHLAGASFEDTWNELKNCHDGKYADDRTSCGFADRLEQEIARAQAKFGRTQEYSNIQNNFG
jgi:hypothetical protein